MCAKVGAGEITDNVRLLRPFDTTTDICALPDGLLSIAGLQSYYRDAAAKASPLRLWGPPMGDDA